jgi:NADPH-dependent glutamate synthase beta subunit-like oxidoreductase
MTMTAMLLRDFSSLDRKARMKIESQGLPMRSAHERIMDFDEAIIRLDEEWAIQEATRCIHCPDPAPCQKACPGGNDISYAMWLIENGQFLEAASVYRQTSSLPEVCGRICPQERLCEGQHAGATHRKGLFTGGDVVTGPHLVVTAMVAGRKAAAAIDRYLGW